MIKIAEISDPIAEATWQIKGEDGQITSHRIIVGHPHPENQEDDKSDWYCPVMIEGFLPQIKAVMGIGSVDSLMNAMHLVQVFFDKHKEQFVGMD